MNLQTFLNGLLTFLNDTFVPFLLVIAFIIFLWNIVRYFIIGGANEKEQEKARQYTMWSILAFVIIVSIWGIVNLFVGDFGFGGKTESVTPDYIQYKDPFGDGSYDDYQDPCDAAPDPDACRDQYNNAV